MKKPGKMHCVIRIKPTGEQVKMQRNLKHWGSWDTVVYIYGWNLDVENY